jgi:teichuronic acid biosynthesis glycosyltransferase TuaG
MKVSIITPCYNSSRFIKDTINSVIAQTFQEWEMIIVDDLSQDNSAEIIMEYSKNDNRIILIQLNKNVGAAEARNIALREAKGQFIAFLDSDDLWHPDKLKYQLQFMTSKDIAFSFSSYQLIDINGNLMNKTINVPEVIGYKDYLRNTIIGCLTVVIDRNKTGYFEMPKIKSSHDMALWLLIMRGGINAYGINKPLASYRILPGSNTSNRWKSGHDVWKVYRHIEKISIHRSSCYFISYIFNALKKRI